MRRKRFPLPRIQRMKSSLIAVLFGLASLLPNVAGSAELELDSEIMKSIEDLNKSLSSNIAIGAAAASTSDTRELAELFAQVETYFVAKGGADDAVELTRKSRVLVADISASVAKKDFTRATDQSTDLSRTCKTCHTFYKKS